MAGQVAGAWLSWARGLCWARYRAAAAADGRGILAAMAYPCAGVLLALNALSELGALELARRPGGGAAA
jgi:hypothetical protein